MEFKERCKECMIPIEIDAKDNNVVVFHTKCYTKWFKDVIEYGRRQQRRQAMEDED